jgi:hypothetical protein
LKLLTVYILSVLSFILGKTEIFLVPCPIKYLTHLDCPGCGFQRSILALINGDFIASFSIYPPTLMFLISSLAGIGTTILKGNTDAKILKGLYLATGLIVMVNYLYKIFSHQLH